MPSKVICTITNVGNGLARISATFLDGTRIQHELHVPFAQLREAGVASTAGTRFGAIVHDANSTNLRVSGLHELSHEEKSKMQVQHKPQQGRNYGNNPGHSQSQGEPLPELTLFAHDGNVNPDAFGTNAQAMARYITRRRRSSGPPLTTTKLRQYYNIFAGLATIAQRDSNSEQEDEQWAQIKTQLHMQSARAKYDAQRNVIPRELSEYLTQMVTLAVQSKKHFLAVKLYFEAVVGYSSEHIRK
jgi:CRISPR type III-A-associated protein Csm2